MLFKEQLRFQFLDLEAGYSNIFGHATWTASALNSFRIVDVAHWKDRGVKTKKEILQEKNKQTDPNRLVCNFRDIYRLWTKYFLYGNDTENTRKYK